jgi:asparagine synthase (glutamine-hydrolysing)
MCGICGVFEYASSLRVDRERLARMNATIRHRGPDDDGFFVRERVGLAMRRLRIIDLAGGAQPITNEDETIWIVFNGEIYNYRDLRQDLIRRGHRFRTQSDTEVIVHAYEEFGSHSGGRPSVFGSRPLRQKTALLRRPGRDADLWFRDQADLGGSAGLQGD